MKTTGERLLCTLAVAGLFFVLATPVHAEWNKGLEAFKAKDYGTAIQEFEEVTKTNEDYAGGYYMLGYAQMKAGKLSPAIASLRKAVDKAAENPAEQSGYQLMLGQALVNTKQYNEAYSTLKSISTSSVQAKARTNYALLFAKAATESNHPGEAIQVLKGQLSGNSSNAQLWSALAVAQDANGDNIKAFEAFKKAFDLSNDVKIGRNGARSALSVARRPGSASTKVKYYTEAAKLAERFSAIEPVFDNFLLTGEAWMGAKEYKKALTWFGKAQAKQPNNSLVHFYSGQCYSSLEQYDQAISKLQEALSGGNTRGKLRTQVYNQLGYVYDNQGLYDKAIQSYRESGNSAKIEAMNKKKEAEEQNKIAEKERREYEAKIRALEKQIQELEALGDVEEANRIREFLNNLKNG